MQQDKGKVNDMISERTAKRSNNNRGNIRAKGLQITGKNSKTQSM